MLPPSFLLDQPCRDYPHQRRVNLLERCILTTSKPCECRAMLILLFWVLSDGRAEQVRTG